MGTTQLLTLNQSLRFKKEDGKEVMIPIVAVGDEGSASKKRKFLVHQDSQHY